VKHTKEQEYNWSFNRVNSKGEVLFSHSTNETVDDVSEYLDSKNINHELTQGAGSTMFWIYFNDNKYAYFSTSGRWAPWNKGGYPSKHFTSKGIEDFCNRFLFSKPNFKVYTETEESVIKFLEEEQIEYKIENKVVKVITKLIPRKDGRGNRKRYAFEYIIGKGTWRGMRSDNTYGETYYQSSGIENFIEKFFRRKEGAE
jgi:hypothetical protein